ncbi:F-box protein-like protein [Drosera capensis]
MADRGLKRDHEDNTSSSSCDYTKQTREPPPYPYQSNWMSRWIGTTHMQAPFINKLAPSVTVKECPDSVPRCLEGGFHMGPPMPKKRVGKEIEAATTGMISECIATESRAEMHITQGNDSKFSGKYLTFPTSLKRKDATASASTRDNVMASQVKPPTFNHEGASNSAPSFQRHLRNNAYIAQGQSGCQNYSSFLLQQEGKEHQPSPAPISTQHHISSSGNALPLVFREHQRLPSSVSNVHTMKISSTFDSVQNSHGGPPRFSQTTHHFFFTHKTNFNLSNEQQFIESTMPTQQEGFGFSKYSSLPPRHDSNRRGGVKIQPLWNSSDSKEDPSSLGAQCESSAETGTMVLDTPQYKSRPQSSGVGANVTSGVASSPLTKDSGRDLQLAITGPGSAKEKRRRVLIAEIPEINLEPPDLNVEPSSRQMEVGSSRTQSLDVGHHLSHAGESCKSVSDPIQDHDVHLEPTSRWVKRLKLSPLNSLGYGTESSNLRRPSALERIMILKRMMMHKHYGQHQMTLDQSKEPLRNGERPSIAVAGKNQSGMLSHFWIRRWCQSRPVTEEKNSESVVICQPESTKLGLDDLEKKPFPSIAAMALMGKAMKGFHPCEFRRRGPVMYLNIPHKIIAGKVPLDVRQAGNEQNSAATIGRFLCSLQDAFGIIPHMKLLNSISIMFQEKYRASYSSLLFPTDYSCNYKR